MMKMTYGMLIGCLVLLTGCAGISQESKDGYTFLHWNNPEMVGLSAGATVITKDGHVVGTQITHKNGYLETLGGQAIQAGAIVGGAALIGDGLKKSGDRVTNTQDQKQKQKGIVED